MITFAGLDVSQAKTTVCVVDEWGLVTWRGSCASAPLPHVHQEPSHMSLWIASPIFCAT